MFLVDRIWMSLVLLVILADIYCSMLGCCGILIWNYVWLYFKIYIYTQWFILQGLHQERWWFILEINVFWYVILCSSLDSFLKNNGTYLPNNTVSHSRKQNPDSHCCDNLKSCGFLLENVVSIPWECLAVHRSG